MNELFWVLLYLHNWDPVDPVTKVQPVYPEIHAIYKTWQEAEASRNAMSDPTKYWVRSARCNSG